MNWLREAAKVGLEVGVGVATGGAAAGPKIVDETVSHLGRKEDPSRGSAFAAAGLRCHLTGSPEQDSAPEGPGPGRDLNSVLVSLTGLERDKGRKVSRESNPLRSGNQPSQRRSSCKNQ